MATLAAHQHGPACACYPNYQRVKSYQPNSWVIARWSTDLLLEWDRAGRDGTENSGAAPGRLRAEALSGNEAREIEPCA